MFNLAIVIPVFQHGDLLSGVITRLSLSKLPLIIVNDGSTHLQSQLIHAACRDKQITLINRSSNGGKGAAVIDGLREAKTQGYTHVFQIDADGQHDIESLPTFVRSATQNQHALILGYPQFDDTVPFVRYIGRQFTQIWVCINSLSLSIRDSMCGFRIYPISPIINIIDSVNIGKKMDFDIEICVRALWAGMRVINLPVRVAYPKMGISNFRNLHDNILISWMHTRLFFGMLLQVRKKLISQLMK